MKKIIPCVLIIVFCLGSYEFSLAQAQKISNQVEQELKNVLSEWIQHYNKKEFEAMRLMLADDFLYLNDGKRHNKNETLELFKSSPHHPITNQIKIIKTGSGGDMAFVVFDVLPLSSESGNSSQALPTVIVVFKKINDKWRFMMSDEHTNNSK